jgi:hypothetical protein
LHTTGADPGFQVRGDALKKIGPSGGRREFFWGIPCEKSQFYAKKIIFFPILGGGRAPGAPPWIRPCIIILYSSTFYTKDHVIRHNLKIPNARVSRVSLTDVP